MATRFDLTVQQGSDGLSLRTAAGFGMLKGRSVLVTGRGLSRPSSAVRHGIVHRLSVKPLSRRAVEVWQDAVNTANDPLDVRDITLWDGLLELDGTGWRVFHAELYKQERFWGGYSMVTGGLFAAMPETEGAFGLSEDTPFPGIFFTHPERGTVLLSVLSQNRCRPCWELRRRGRASRLVLREAFSGISAIPVPPGRTFSGERWVVLSVSGGVQEALDEYYRLLRRRIAFPGASSFLREAVVWGSWNYNTRPRGHGDITHDYIAANARALEQLVPKRPRVVMIDDGYQRGSSHKATGNWYCSCLDIFHDEEATPHDPALFPSGMKTTAEAIRRTGAMPAIWATPRLDRDAALVRARPDWLLRADKGLEFPGRMAFLDYSLPEVRDYARRAWWTITQEWGYSGIKLDFWTNMFETPALRFRRGDRTAIELRNLFLSDLRECVPDDGYVITCCTTNAGNPFLGRFAEASRSGDDVGDGSWARIRDCAEWLTVSSLFYRDNALLSDPDSIGYSALASLEENRLWATTALFGGAMCEIGGDLTQPAPEAAQLLATALKFLHPRVRSWHDALGPGVFGLPAGHWMMERSDGLWEAWLNPSSWPRLIHLPHPRRELWTGKTMQGDCLVPRHGARVFRV